MGKIRPELVKRLSRMIVVNYYDYLSADFEHNKKVVQEILYMKYGGKVSKRLRNRVAGYVTRLYKRIQRRPEMLEELSVSIGAKRI